jgi:Wzt C-terminal domain
MHWENARYRDGRWSNSFFVSHNLPAIVNLCTSAMCLNDGKIVQVGEPGAVCASYAVLRTTAPRCRSLSSVLEEITLLDAACQPSPHLMQGDTLKFRLVVMPPEDKGIISLVVHDARDSVIFELFDPQFSLSKTSGINTVIDINAGKLPLLPGVYTADVWFGDRMGNHIDRIYGAIEFEVVSAPASDVGPPLAGGFAYTGSLYYPSKWTRISSVVEQSSDPLSLSEIGNMAGA